MIFKFYNVSRINLFPFSIADITILSKVLYITYQKYYINKECGGENVSEIPVAPLVRILKDAGAERISDDAKKAFADAVEAAAEELAKKVIKAAEHAGRKTVTVDDIKFICE